MAFSSRTPSHRTDPWWVATNVPRSAAPPPPPATSSEPAASPRRPSGSMLLTDNAPPEDNNNNKDDDVGVFPPFPDVPTTDDMATHQISWDAHRKKLTLSTAAEGNPLKRATGAFDDDTNMTKDDTVEKQVGDGVSDSTHQPPPAKKIHWTVWSDDTPPPAAPVEKQPRVRPRKNPLPSRVPAAAVAVQTAAQAQPPLDVAPPSSSAGGKGYHGVHWHKPKKRFEAWLRNGGKRLYLGIYDNAEEAAFVYDRAWRDLGNDPLLLNFDDTVPIPQEYLASVADASSKIAAFLANREAQKQRASERKKSVANYAPAAREEVQPAQSPLAVAERSKSKSGSGKSEYRGVIWHQQRQNFQTQIWDNGKQLYVGRSADAKEAAFMRDRAWRDLGKDPLLLNFDDTVPIPRKYLASVANASKIVANYKSQAQKNKTSVQNIKDGAPPPGAAHRGHEVAPAVASSPTIINYNYNVYSGASATFHINHS